MVLGKFLFLKSRFLYRISRASSFKIRHIATALVGPLVVSYLDIRKSSSSFFHYLKLFSTYVLFCFCVASQVVQSSISLLCIKKFKGDSLGRQGVFSTKYAVADDHELRLFASKTATGGNLTRDCFLPRNVSFSYTTHESQIGLLDCTKKFHSNFTVETKLLYSAPLNKF